MTMKISRLRTIWIIIALCFYTAMVCTRSVLKYFFSTPTRPWVNKTIHHWVNQLLNEVQVRI